MNLSMFFFTFSGFKMRRILKLNLNSESTWIAYSTSIAFRARCGAMPAEEKRLVPWIFERLGLQSNKMGLRFNFWMGKHSLPIYQRVLCQVSLSIIDSSLICDKNPSHPSYIHSMERVDSIDKVNERCSEPRDRRHQEQRGKFMLTNESMKLYKP